MARRVLGPATLAVTQAVSRAVKSADALLVACSGGADSLALAAGAAALTGRQGGPLSAVCVDHGLQPDSAAVAAVARRQLMELGIAEVEVVTVRVDPQHPGGPEAAARAVRYAALETAALARNATVLLGHTRDDQAETVLLGLARGSGPRSLAGMPVRRDRFMRPLLDLPRSVTRQACRELGVQPWEDPHNGDPSFARVRVRARVLPVLEAELGPGVAAALVRTAALAREDADLLDALADAADPGGAELAVPILARLPPALRRRVLRRWLVRQGARGPGHGHVAAVDGLVTDWHGQRGVDVPGLRVCRVADRLVTTPSVRQPAPPPDAVETDG